MELKTFYCQNLYIRLTWKKVALVRRGGVAKWPSRPPQKQDDPGSNPDRVRGFSGKHSNAVV
jgi:hypothetical protein